MTAKIRGQELGVVRVADLLSAPTELPTTPSTLWREPPGFILRTSAPNLFWNNVLNEYGQIYAGYPVNQ